MAWETIAYSCGHTEQQQLFGPHRDREARVAAAAKHECAVCRAAGSDLTGTPKQIAWAIDLRAVALPKAEAMYADLLAKLAANTAGHEDKAAVVRAAIDAKIAEVRGRTAARDWIENRDPDLEIYEVFRDAIFAVNK